MGYTGDILAIGVLLLVIGMTWLLLRRRMASASQRHQRNRADKGKVKCYERLYNGVDSDRCKSKAGWVTPNGYFCDEHWEKNSRRAGSKVRWATKLAWKRTEADAWTI